MHPASARPHAIDIHQRGDRPHRTRARRRRGRRSNAGIDALINDLVAIEESIEGSPMIAAVRALANTDERSGMSPLLHYLTHRCRPSKTCATQKTPYSYAIDPDRQHLWSRPRCVRRDPARRRGGPCARRSVTSRVRASTSSHVASDFLIRVPCGSSTGSLRTASFRGRHRPSIVGASNCASRGLVCKSDGLY